jgi:hypothetical protein
MSDGQLAVNSNLASPGLFLKDSNGDVVKVGPTHIGTTAPNVSPASGGQAGNSKGEQWLDTSGGLYLFKVWDGTAWRTQEGAFVSISGDTMTGPLVMANQQQVQFRETTGNGTNYVALQATASVATNKVITLPDITGTVVTTGDTGSVTSTMILDGTILNADINASAAIADTKLATISGVGKVSNSATTAASANTANAIVARDASGNFTAGTITAALTGNASTVTTNANLTGDITSVGNATSIASGVIVNTDINASAAIVDTKLATISTASKVSNSATTATSANTLSAIVARDGSGNFTAGTITAALTGAASSNVLKAGDTMTGALVVVAGTAASPGIGISGDLNTGIYSPGADQLAVTAGGTGRLFVSTTAVSSSLAINCALGASGTPSITFSGDTNTGIWSPSADAMAVSTAGAERVRFASDGKVGIGTASPARLLDVANDASIYGVRVGRGNSALATNTVLGANALGAATTGADNTAVGNSALAVNTTGGSNTAFGTYALLGNTTGSFNTAVGQGALFSSLTSDSNTATGIEALYFNTTGGSNVANGFRALKANTTGSENIAVGYEALQANTVGNANVAIGHQALLVSTTAINNTAVGLRALQSTTSGTTNTAIGIGAGSTGAQANTTGNNNTFLGAEATGASATASNVITLGNASVATLRCQVTTITSLSDARDKKEITSLRAGLGFISKLRPVSFTWNSRDQGKVGIEDTGFIAQELLAVQEDTGIVIPNLVSQENPDRLEAGYGTLLPVLVNAVQELAEMVKELQGEIATLKSPIN